MRILTTNETQSVGGGKTPIKFKDAPPTTLPTITVTAPAACSTDAQLHAISIGAVTGAYSTLVMAAGEDAAGGGPLDPVGDGVAAGTVLAGAATGARDAYVSQYAKCLMAKRGLHTEIP